MIADNSELQKNEYTQWHKKVMSESGDNQYYAHGKQ
jgi:hypothetical protein